MPARLIGRDAAQVPPQEAELHQVDAVDLHVAARDVAELQFHFGRVARLDRGHLGQVDRLAEEVGDRLLGVGKAVFHAAILADGVGRLAQAMMDLAEDVDRLPLVRAFHFAAGGLVDAFRIGHLAGTSPGPPCAGPWRIRSSR